MIPLSIHMPWPLALPCFRDKVLLLQGDPRAAGHSMHLEPRRQNTTV